MVTNPGWLAAAGAQRVRARVEPSLHAPGVIDEREVPAALADRERPADRRREAVTPIAAAAASRPEPNLYWQWSHRRVPSRVGVTTLEASARGRGVIRPGSMRITHARI